MSNKITMYECDHCRKPYYDALSANICKKADQEKACERHVISYMSQLMKECSVWDIVNAIRKTRGLPDPDEPMAYEDSLD